MAPRSSGKSGILRCPEVRTGLREALGQGPADAVFTNLTLFNPFTCEWEEQGSIAVQGGTIVGLGEYQGRREIDLKGATVAPGLIDTHVHIESSLLTPAEYGRLVLGHGTTTVIADPHEIANVAGKKGLDYMLQQREHTPLDIFFMLPSCVPATPMDRGGAQLDAEDLAGYLMKDGILGLGEMMNVPGVLRDDEEVWKKLGLCTCIDGHAPLLTGRELNAYLYAGMQSDHECTSYEEAREKLQKGMYIMIREGSTERNLVDLLPLVTPCTAPRCSFATDDRHADMLIQEGHIDDCIRKSIAYGLELEIALRMATLSGAERFGLTDRGALAPGRIADLCVVSERDGFTVEKTYKSGNPAGEIPYHQPSCLRTPFHCRPVEYADLRIPQSGRARVIRVLPHQIITEPLYVEIVASGIPDTDEDILKAVVCDRYRNGGCGLGLVHGFGLQRGAIACSVSHDSHNIVATGVSDDDIMRAASLVAVQNGGMAVVEGKEVTLLPLPCAGLMSDLPYEEVGARFGELEQRCASLGCIEHPFMYLSFIALTVIPHLRLTERGVFDVQEFRDVPLFIDGQS
jgi:adenine deaminase